jgi:hypothetical protein
MTLRVVARLGRVSSADAPATLLSDDPGCHDEEVTAAPGGGAVVISQGCGEGVGRAYVIR